MDIDKLSREELISKITSSQINSLNKKLKQFKKEGISEHEELVRNLMGEHGQYNKSGSLTKSKKYFNTKEDWELKKILNTLTKLNNHEIFGTVNKYNSYATQSWNTLRDTVEKILEDYGHDREFINQVINSKSFYDKLYLAFNNRGKSYGSEQIVEKVALDYYEEGITQQEKEEITSTIERSVSKMESLKDDINFVDDLLKARNGVDRSGGNRR